MKKKNIYIIIFLIIACLAAFGRISGNHFINLDDPGYITNNYLVQNGLNFQNIKWAFTTSYLAFWHPLTWISHMLDWSIFGTNAGGHHLVSLLLHIGTVLFLFLFLNKTTNNIWSSAFAASLFALHPLRVESVAWASERKDVLSMFFGMASIYFYAFYAEGSKLSKYFLCLMLFALSLMSKPMMITLPFVLLLLDYWPLGRWQRTLSDSSEKRLKLAGRLLWEKIPFIILSIASSVIVLWAEKKAGSLSSVDILPLLTRTANAIVSYVTYLEKTFWPVNLVVFYPYDFFLLLWEIIISGIILILITLVIIYGIKQMPFLFTGWFWYLGTLVPMIGLVQVGKHAMADRYTYLPSIGIAIMLAWGIPLLFKREEIRKKVLLPASVAMLATLSFLTWVQCGYWKSSITLFNHASRVMKNNELARGNRGADFTELGQYQQQQEIQGYNKAISLKPDNAETYYNRGIAFSKIGQYQNAIKDYNEAISLKPDYAEAYNNRGIIYGQHGQYQLAIEDFNKVISMKPDHIKAYNNRGLAYSELGQYQRAVKDFNKVIRLKPDYANAYSNRANVFIKKGDSISGCRDARKACALGNCKILEDAAGKELCR
jgi:lipoprotein NlpI